MSKCTDAERQARREADREMATAAVEALMSSAGWQQWLSLRRHFHRYSLGNQLLIAMQKPDASRVAGFRAWLKLGYCVQRGERALRIWVPMAPSKHEIVQWRRDGSPADRKPRTRFRLGPVFDRSQVAPLPAPAEPVPLDPPVTTVSGDDLDWALAPLAQLAAEVGASVVVEPLPDAQGGFFDPFTKTIGLNAKRSVNHQVKTLVHELGHCLLHATDDEPQDERRFTYSEEELVVESIAFTVCGSLGLDTSAFSIPYLASWSEQGSLQTIHAAARTIDEIARRIEAVVDGDYGEFIEGPVSGAGGERSGPPQQHTVQPA